MQHHGTTIKHPGRSVLIAQSEVPGMENAFIASGRLYEMCDRGCTESISSPGTQVSISRIWHVRHGLDGSDGRSEFLRKMCGSFKAIRQQLRVLEGGE